MSGIKTHKDLEVWKQAINFVTQIYRATENFPKSEEFGLKSQIRRATVSIPTNIAEGAARNSTKEFIQFLYIALGSISELETLFIISENLNLLKTGEFNQKLTLLRKMLLRLIGSMKNGK